MIIAVIVIGAIALANKKKTKYTDSVDNNTQPVRISSFDLNVYIPKLGEDFKEKWITELKKYGLDVEIHPDFDINNQTGFLPFKLVISKNSKYIKSKMYNGKTILTGFELDISTFNSEEYFSYFDKGDLDKLSQDYKDKIKKCELDFFFTVKPVQNTSEYRMAWFTAATLVTLYDGILSDPQKGVEYQGQEAINKAIELSNQFENSIPDNKWKLHDFEKWN